MLDQFLLSTARLSVCQGNMAASPLNPKSHYHVRSNSLPSRTHPLISEVEEQLSRLRASEAKSSSSSISQKLGGLQDLHDHVDKLLQLPLTQQTLAQEHHAQWAEELLNGSVRLLDVCGIAKDVLLQTKECTNEIQSFMRRRRGGDAEFGREVRNYLVSRKSIKKAIHKTLKGMESKCNNKTIETVAMVNMLSEVEAVTLSVFESLLSFVAGPKLPSKSSGWFLVSKLVHPKRVSCEDEETKLEKVDAALQSLLRTSKSDDLVHIENAQNLLGKFEPSIQNLEEELECLFRRLIKTRVSLLNIFNH